MAAVELTLADPGQRTAVANMMQLYTHDFSELWSGTAKGELSPDGRFADYPLDPYWSDPTCKPLLIKADGCLAGFALLNQATHSGKPADHNMAEFFVVRKHRRGGVGTAAALALFTRFPGQWEVAVTRRNLAARTFWRQAISALPGPVPVEQIVMDDAAWKGPILRFRAPD